MLAWRHANASLWFVPSLLVCAAAVLSTALVELDHRLGTAYPEGGWLFGGSADGARTILSVIAGSLITVVAVAFSITIIAIQQASTQFTPRVLRNFTRDRGNQVVLGTYIGTFTYALLVLRRVRAATETRVEFVPSIAISAGMLLALISVGMLVYFIHHVAQSLQVTSLLRSLRRDLDREIEKLFPERVGEAARELPADDPATPARGDDGSRHEVVLRLEDEGYLERIDEAALERIAVAGARLVVVEVQLGEYVRRGDIVLRAHFASAPTGATIDAMQAAFQVDGDRSLLQDPMFAVRQIVDIGVKALSPGINDPTTAEEALDHLGGALGLLAQRRFPSPARDVEGARFVFRVPSFDDFVVASFSQLRRAARTDLHVTLHLIRILHGLQEAAPAHARRALRRETLEVLAGFDTSLLTARERRALRAFEAPDTDGPAASPSEAPGDRVGVRPRGRRLSVRGGARSRGYRV